MNIIAFFTSSGNPATGLSPTIRIRNVDTTALVISAGAMSEIGDGFYKYSFAGYNPQVDYAIRCDGTAVLPAAERYVYGGNELTEEVDNILTTTQTLTGSNVNIENNLTTLTSEVTAIGADVTTISADLKRALGLMHENIYIDQPTYDGNNNLVSARVRIYSVPGSVGSVNDVLATYQITSVGTGAGKFSYWEQVQI